MIVIKNTMIRGVRLSIIAFLCLSVGFGWAQQATVIRNVRLFDGEQVIEQTSVRFAGDRIDMVGFDLDIPPGAVVIDGRGKTLLPGLIDAHVHIWDEAQLRRSLIFGVTTVVDMFMEDGLMRRIKTNQSTSPDGEMATLISAGTLVTAPSGHGTQFGVEIPTIASPDEAQAFVDERIAEGSDFIKIIFDSGAALGGHIPTISPQILEAVIRSAHNRGKLAVVHVLTLSGAKTALASGADGLAHLYCDDAYDPNFGVLAAECGAFVIPTLSVLESVCGVSGASELMEDVHLSDYLNQIERIMLRQTFPRHAAETGFSAAQKGIRQLHDYAVPILAGTDAPNPGTTYGISLHRELVLLVDAGLSPTEALRAATSLPAEKFGITGRGYVRPGCFADLMLVEGDPIADIRVTRAIVKVWKNGAPVNRDAARKMVRAEQETAERSKSAPPPEGLASGLISNFESDSMTTCFGTGWSVSTDAIMGGKSTAEIRRVAGGARGSAGAMRITGMVAGGGVASWAGAFFTPGKTYMAPADLSFKTAISFWARGDGRTYAVMVFTQSMGMMPATQVFSAGSDWARHVFPYEKFSTDGSDVTGIFVGGLPEKGDFRLEIDDVRLE